MKKLFILLAVASLGFVACNNDASDDAQRIADSTRNADSLAKVAADAAAADSAIKATVDTLKATVDSLKK